MRKMIISIALKFLDLQLKKLESDFSEFCKLSPETYNLRKAVETASSPQD